MKKRLKHNYKVAEKMMEFGKENNLKEKELQELFVLGLNHDIGYEFVTDTKFHNKKYGEYSNAYKNSKKLISYEIEI